MLFKIYKSVLIVLCCYVCAYCIVIGVLESIREKERGQVLIDNKYILTIVALYVTSYLFYRVVSHGLGHKAEYLQLRRFIPCAILAILPAALVQLPLQSTWFLSSVIVGASWVVTYPLLYFLTNRKVSNDFGFHLDIVFGLYLLAWLIAVKVLIVTFRLAPVFLLTLLALLEVILLSVPLYQYGYFLLYGTCIDEQGMTLIQETNYNEVIEYFKSLPRIVLVTVIALTIMILFLFFQMNTGLWLRLSSQGSVYATMLNDWQIAILVGMFVFLTYYFFRRKKGLLARTGIIELYLDVQDYLRNSQLYTKNLAQRLADLKVTPSIPRFDKPSTILLVIGESESRDYMSAFCDYPENTTPWLKAHKEDPNFILFPHAYACLERTVASLERALTEVNQYNDKQFYTSCSIIDIAKAAGYHTYWFSNQGHLGSADTPVTLIANTSGTAKWTKQRLNQVQYDEALLKYLQEVPSNQNNFVVLHLKGSHFNFINRYPESFTKWGTAGKYELIPNYINSVAYTDFILQSAYQYAAEHLNLQAMLYFSDHATIPDKRRSPNFNGFAGVRVPMFAYFSPEYQEKNPEIVVTLKDHRNNYFTTDLAYELICSILNIKSNRYDEANSLASPKFKYTRAMLRTNLGKISLSEDVEK